MLQLFVRCHRVAVLIQNSYKLLTALQYICIRSLSLITRLWISLSVAVCLFFLLSLSLYLHIFVCLSPLSLLISSPSLFVLLHSHPVIHPSWHSLWSGLSLYSFCIHHFLFSSPSLCLVLQPFRMKVWKSPSTRCCSTDCLVSTRLHYKPLSTTSIGERNTHTHIEILLYLWHVCLCPCGFSLHVFQRAAFFRDEPDEPP